MYLCLWPCYVYLWMNFLKDKIHSSWWWHKKKPLQILQTFFHSLTRTPRYFNACCDKRQKAIFSYQQLLPLPACLSSFPPPPSPNQTLLRILSAADLNEEKIERLQKWHILLSIPDLNSLSGRLCRSLSNDSLLFPEATRLPLQPGESSSYCGRTPLASARILGRK